MEEESKTLEGNSTLKDISIPEDSPIVKVEYLNSVTDVNNLLGRDGIINKVQLYHYFYS